MKLHALMIAAGLTLAGTAFAMAPNDTAKAPADVSAAASTSATMNSDKPVKMHKKHVAKAKKSHSHHQASASREHHEMQAKAAHHRHELQASAKHEKHELHASAKQAKHELHASARQQKHEARELQASAGHHFHNMNATGPRHEEVQARAHIERHNTRAMGAGPLSPSTDLDARARENRMNNAYGDWQRLQSRR